MSIWAQLKSLNPNFRSLNLSKENNSIGRSATSDHILDIALVSKTHFEITKKGKDIFVSDKRFVSQSHEKKFFFSNFEKIEIALMERF